MKLPCLSLPLILLTACQQTTVVQLPPASYNAVKSKKETPFSKANRETLEKINAAFLANPEYYEIPPQTTLDISDMDIEPLSALGGRCIGRAKPEYESYEFLDSKGKRHRSYRVKNITILIANKVLDADKYPKWTYETTLAHELAHAYLATAYPIIFVKSHDKKITEGHATTVEFRYLQKIAPAMTEEKFLAGKPSDYRSAYLHFKKNYIRNGHVEWEVLDKKEYRLSKRL